MPSHVPSSIHANRMARNMMYTPMEHTAVTLRRIMSTTTAPSRSGRLFGGSRSSLPPSTHSESATTPHAAPTMMDAVMIFLAPGRPRQRTALTDRDMCY